jgi:integrase
VKPYRRGLTFWVRLVGSNGGAVRISCGTRDGSVARQMGSMLERLAARNEYDVIDRVRDRRLDFVTLWAAYCAEPSLVALRQSFADTDLSPLVDEWQRALMARGTASAERYARQVRELIPDDRPFPRSHFIRRAIAEHLAGLGVSGSTQNRHRAALRQFGRWLLERDVIEHNPVADVAGARENPGRLIFHTTTEQQAIIRALPQPFKALEAIMAACGAEWQAVIRLRRRDVDLGAQSIELHGSKTSWRNRTAMLTESWTLPAISEYIRDFLPNAMLFERIEDKRAHAAHRAACTAAQVAVSHLHDWRHSYAVTLRRRGVSDVLIARQLGHSNTVLVATRYGRFSPDATDFARAFDKPFAHNFAQVDAVPREVNGPNPLPGYAEGETRTRKGVASRGILSPLRLPIPPPRLGGSM